MRNVAKYSPALFAKPADALHDHEILRRAGAALRAKRPAAWPRGCRAKAEAVTRRLGPDGTLDWMLKTGRYGVPNAGKLRLLAALPGFGPLREAAGGARPPAGRPHPAAPAR